MLTTVKVSLLAAIFFGAAVLVAGSAPHPRHGLHESVAPTAAPYGGLRGSNTSARHGELFRNENLSSVAVDRRAPRGAAFFAGLSGIPQYQVLHHFVESPQNPYGGLIQGSDGDFYGTTSSGGDSLAGTVIKLDASGALTLLHSFVGYDGAGPWAPLIQANDGTYYGTTVGGLGSAALGTVFKMDVSGAMQTIHFFTGADGYFPQAELIQAADGNFYGTTVYGGANDKGTVFKMDAQGNVATLHSFAGGDGEFPSAKLIQANDGNFYGTTDYGGTFGLGTVFKMHPTSGVVTTLYSFEQVIGNTPSGGLTQGSDGNFYGVTIFGGDQGKGTAFKTDASGVVTLLHTFAGSDGARPFGGVIQGSDGGFYGTTSGGGTGAAGIGTAFRMSASGIVTPLHFFSGNDGNLPLSRLTQAMDGNFYGTTFGGGPWTRGTAFKMSASGIVTTLTVFPATDGSTPSAGLLQASDGNFYGTTQGGGARFQGSVFKMDASSGAVTLLHSFAEATGLTYPSAELTQGRDGYLYGTTLFGGGDALAGTVFKMDASGVMTTLHRFAGSDGAYPYAGLLHGNDGNSYGTTYSGGANNKGVVFKISGRSGAVTTLHSFAGRDGANPQSALIQAGGFGDLYGTTSSGGRHNQGSVFKMNPRSGAVTTLHSFTRFSGFDGANPQSALALRSDGDLYGTTPYGGAYGKGTIFKIPRMSGALTTLHSFTGTDGATPQAKLISGADGNLYGTTYEGGADDEGTVFMVSASGAVTTIHSFAGSDGGNPDSRLIRGSDGYLYGTTSTGGSSDIGVIFRLPIADASQSIPKGLSASANHREPPSRAAQYQRSFFPIGQRQQQDRKR